MLQMNFLPIILIITIITLKIPPQWSIVMGIIFSLFFKSDEKLQQLSKKWSSKILQLSLILLGASLNFQSVLRDGLNGVLMTCVSISLVLIAGELLSKLFKVASPLSHLISVGTAICGGSAIGAVGPVLKADSLTLATSLGIVFILNAMAVFIFPPIGHALNLSQYQFGTWSALAIHDTSSVVAASQIYGEEALKVGATLKLTRALWIIPVSLLFSFVKKENKRTPIPWSIVFFLLNSLIFTFVASLNDFIPWFKEISKQGFSITLFLIGISLNRQQILSIQLRPIIFSTVLWAITLSASLVFVLNFPK